MTMPTDIRRNYAQVTQTAMAGAVAPGNGRDRLLGTVTALAGRHAR